MEDKPTSPWDVKAATVATEEQNRFFWRYAAVTFVFLLWRAFWSEIDDIYGLGFNVVFTNSLPALGVLIYLLTAFLGGIFQAQFARLISVVFGPLLAFVTLALIAGIFS
jgi:hypothetical protein